jgi:hypothetical protein
VITETAESVDIVDEDDRRTPPALWEEIQRRWGPHTVDVAANAENALLPRFYDRARDGLRQCWDGENAFGNIPFSNIRPWLEKAWDSNALGVTLLLPANRTDQPFWAELVEPYRDRPGSRLMTHFPRGRPRFLSGSMKNSSSPKFGIVLLRWGPRPIGSGA